LLNEKLMLRIHIYQEINGWQCGDRFQLHLDKRLMVWGTVSLDTK